MANRSKALKKSLQKDLKNLEDISVSKALNIIVQHLKKKGNFNSCVLTDNNGLIMAESIHKQENRDNLSATSALIDDTSERISDYIKIGKINLSYFVSKNVMVWMLPIELPNCDDRYILLATKGITILTGMPKSILKLLGKEEINIHALLLISSKWIAKVCKE